MARKTKYKKNTSQKIGLPPGSLQYVGNIKPEKVNISVIDYQNENFKETEVRTISEIYPYRDSASESWINIEGIHDTEIIEKIGKHFGIHYLTLEDILNTEHRPTFEEHDNYLFFTLKILIVNQENEVDNEQISLVLGKNWLISFQEQHSEIFEKIRIRLRDEQARIRKRRVDYLFYALIDLIVDHYFLVIEHFKDDLEIIEENVLREPHKRYLIDIQNLRKELIDFRKVLVPLREGLIDLKSDNFELMGSDVQPYIRDVYEHTLYLFESTEYLQEGIIGVLDLYHSGIGNKTNQIMQVLTIISTIFMPLTFIVGVYGMNFDYLPEIHWKYAYPIVWLVMIGIVLGMLKYFRNKKWI